LVFINFGNGLMASNEKHITAIRQQIASLQNELARLEANGAKNDSLVLAPKEFDEIIEKMTPIVQEWSTLVHSKSSSGQVFMNNDRVITMRGKSISYDFIKSIEKIFENELIGEGKKLGLSILYDLGYILGKEDARSFKQHYPFATFTEQLAAGPMHFALAGWAKVEFLEGSNPSPNENFILKYIHHNSFESEGWLQEKKKSESPVCSWNIGYASGWCEECVGFPLSSAELTCKACGHDDCYFIMAPSSKIHELIEQERKASGINTPYLLPDHFQLKLFHEKLIENDKLLDEALKVAKIGVWKFIPASNELFWSQQLHDIFATKKHKVSNNQLINFYYNSLSKIDLQRLNDLTQKLIETGEPYEIKHRIQLPGKVVKWLECIGQPVYNEKQEIIGISGIVKEITDEIRELRDLDIFFNLSVDLQCIANDAGYFVKVSPSWCKLLGYSMEELTTKPFTDFVHPDDLETTYREMGRLNEGDLSVNFENRYITKDGRDVVISWNSTKDPINNLYYCSARDVTADRQKREALLSNLSEKDILLREIHHRVKNNLQIISSLLSLQSGQKVNPKNLSKLYLDSQNRIKSMAAIHELFYQSENLNRIDISDYIHKLVRDLIHTFKGEKNDVQVDIEVNQIFLNLDTSIPLGLVINEIITNALKHGISEKIGGSIIAKLHSTGKGTYQLLLGDNGKGMEIPGNLNEIESLGLTIISSLVEQLDGSYKINTSSNGTYYTIDFRAQR
jgi:PAS domain S-box-containing protein